MQGLPSFLGSGTASDLLASFDARKGFSPVLHCLHSTHSKSSLNVCAKIKMKRSGV